MESHEIKSELAKWRIATKRSFTKSDSGRLLWYATVFMLIVVMGSAFSYQWAQFELTKPSATTSHTTAYSLDKESDEPKTTFFQIAGILSAASLITLTTAGSMLAAFLVSLLSKIKWEAGLVDRGRFFALLAQTEEKPTILSEEMFHGPIDIVLSQYIYEPHTREDGDERRTTYIHVGGTDVPCKRALEFNNINDSRAAQLIHAELKNLGFKNIQILNDTDHRDSQRRPTCEILIGLCVNTRVNDLLQNAQNPHLFDISRESNGRFSIGAATTGPRGLLTSPSKDNRYRTREDRDFGLIAKVRHHGHVQIIVGGLTDVGTLAVAELFSTQLVDLVRSVDTASKKLVGTNRFAAIYGFTPSDKSTMVLQELRVH